MDKSRASSRAALAAAAILLLLLSTDPHYLVCAPSSRLEVPRSLEDWVQIGRIAWRYYGSWMGVDRNTGLPKATNTWDSFTLWDLGAYIMSILDAEKLEIIPREGEWGSTDRLEKVLNFLKTMKLNEEGIPYWAYRASSGLPDSSSIDKACDPSDMGMLLVALDRLRRERPDLAYEVNSAVRRLNPVRLASDRSKWKKTSGFYAYIAARGYQAFGFGDEGPVRSWLRWGEGIESQGKIEVNGVEFPKEWVTSEPVLFIAFYLEGDPLARYAHRVYLAHERYYQETGEYRAFSEGVVDGAPHYVFEWVVTGFGDRWVVTDATGEEVSIDPVIYLKAALGFHALYESGYTTALLRHLFNVLNSKGVDLATGLPEGITEEGESILKTRSDKTCALVLAAARYAIEHWGSRQARRVEVEISGVSAPAEVVVGERARVNLTLVNNHNFTATGLFLSIYIGGSLVCRYGVGELHPGENLTLVIEFKVPWYVKPGERELRVVLKGYPSVWSEKSLKIVASLPLPSSTAGQGGGAEIPSISANQTSETVELFSSCMWSLATANQTVSLLTAMARQLSELGVTSNSTDVLNQLRMEVQLAADAVQAGNYSGCESLAIGISEACLQLAHELRGEVVAAVEFTLASLNVSSDDELAALVRVIEELVEDASSQEDPVEGLLQATRALNLSRQVVNLVKSRELQTAREWELVSSLDRQRRLTILVGVGAALTGLSFGYLVGWAVSTRFRTRRKSSE